MRHLSQVLASIIAVAVLSGIVVLALIGVQYWRNDRPIVLPKPRGAHPVGRTVFDWTDTRRSRELMVFVWYPAQAGSPGSRAQYIPGKWGEAAARGYFLIPAGRMQTIEVSAITDAPVARGSYSTLVLLPGIGSGPAEYTTLAEDLASHGHIVAGIVPTGSTRNIVFPSGQTADSDIDPDQRNAEVESPVMRTWLDDARFCLDQLLATPRVAGIANPSRVGVVGHSFGGAVAMELLKTDARFKAAATLDGTPWREPPGAAGRRLLVLLSGPPPALLRAFAPDDAGELRASCEANRTECEIEQYERAGHADFSDAAVLPSRFPVPALLMDRGTIDGEKFQRAIADRLLAFFARL